jgi:glycosyltransferase involved in cell wall biosynthesis
MSMNNPKIAWLLTTAYFYWQPAMASLTKIFPETTVFTTLWHGFAPGLEDSFKIELVGERKFLEYKKSETGYGSNFMYVPLKIVNRLLEFKPSVVFCNAFGLWTLLTLLFKPFGRWKVVIAYEGSSPSVDYRNSPPRLAVRRAMVNAADACITNSHAGKAYLTQVLEADKSRVFVQPYEVPAAGSMLFNCTTSNEDFSQYKSPIFMFVGRVTPRKGLHILLEACSILAKQECHDYTVLIVGDGPQQQELKELTEKNNLTSCVKWIGRVEYGRLGEYFHKSDVFVLPTLEDTWGMVILEAMLLGKPILCSKQAGASELVIEGKNGYTFDTNSPEKLAELMHYFINNPDLAKSMGTYSRSVMAKYTPEAAGKFMAEVTSFVLGA